MQAPPPPPPASAEDTRLEFGDVAGLLYGYVFILILILIYRIIRQQLFKDSWLCRKSEKETVGRSISNALQKYVFRLDPVYPETENRGGYTVSDVMHKLHEQSHAMGIGTTDDAESKGPRISKAVPSLDEIMKKLNEMNDKIDRIGKI